MCVPYLSISIYIYIHLLVMSSNIDRWNIRSSLAGFPAGDTAAFDRLGDLICLDELQPPHIVTSP